MGGAVLSRWAFLSKTPPTGSSCLKLIQNSNLSSVHLLPYGYGSVVYICTRLISLYPILNRLQFERDQGFLYSFTSSLHILVCLLLLSCSYDNHDIMLGGYSLPKRVDRLAHSLRA